jgi:signal transduction histidine kinase
MGASSLGAHPPPADSTAAAATTVSTWVAPKLALRPAVGLLVLFLAVGLAQGLLVRSVVLMRGLVPDHPIVIFQLTGALGAWAGLPVVQAAVLNAHPAPARAPRWWRVLAVHLTGYLVFVVLHVAVMQSLRSLLFALDLTRTSGGPLRIQVLWEMQGDMIVYASAAGLLTVLVSWRKQQRAALHAANLEARLAEARLDALTSQVDPHFFFNALNTVSAVMYEDLDKTEKLLDSLGCIMRATLQKDGPTWTLAEECNHTQRYLDLLRARFGERLTVSWQSRAVHSSPARQPASSEALLELAVPRFCIQTLVENAVKHNASRVEPLHVAVSMTRQARCVEVSVEDNGYGFPDCGSATQGSLERLSATLRLLHGDAASLERDESGLGGAQVRLRWMTGRAA